MILGDIHLQVFWCVYKHNEITSGGGGDGDSDGDGDGNGDGW